MRLFFLALAALLAVSARAAAPDSFARGAYFERGLTDLSDPASPPYEAITLLQANGNFVRSVGNRVIETGPWIYRKVAADRAELILGGEWHLLIFKTEDSGTWLGTRGGSEAYNTFSLVAAAGSGRIGNFSTRTVVRPGESSISGFVIVDEPAAVLIRAIGPALRSFGVTDALSRPRLRIRSTATDNGVAENVKWGEQGSALVGLGNATGEALLRRLGNAVGAFPLTSGSDDAAVALVLPPGGYTVEVSSVDPAQTGSALIEVYHLP